MALATTFDDLPGGSGDPLVTRAADAPVEFGVPASLGLAARLASLRAGLGSLLADLEPGLLKGRDAAALYAEFAGLERLVNAGKTLLAPRIAESGHWEQEGHRSPAGLLALLEGGSAGSAKRTLETGQRLVGLPGTEEALREGKLSGPKLTEISEAAVLDPASEGRLLAGAESEPLAAVKERCQQVRTQAAAGDPDATLARIYAERTFSYWNDADGAFCFSGRDTPERGAKLLARLIPAANRLRHDRRAQARGPEATGATGAARSPSRTSQGPRGESEGALRADALFVLVTARRANAAGPEPSTSAGPASAGPGGESDLDALADPADLGRPEDLVAAGPPAMVIVRVDLEVLRRRRALPGELCEIEGQGPVTAPVVASLLDDAFVACVFAEAGDIRAVAHLGRTINQHLRTALMLRDRHCVVPGCGVGYSLEIDHVEPLDSGGDTRLRNLALLCRHHHRMKTFEGWTLERTGPSDQDPGWRFTPLPPFGQEPGLGLDRPGNMHRPEHVPRS